MDRSSWVEAATLTLAGNEIAPVPGVPVSNAAAAGLPMDCDPRFADISTGFILGDTDAELVLERADAELARALGRACSSGSVVALAGITSIAFQLLCAGSRIAFTISESPSFGGHVIVFSTTERAQYTL